MTKGQLHYIEADLAERATDELTAECIVELEAYLLKRAAFDDYLKRRDA